MFVADLFESYVAEAGPQLVVLYPGRFQPFHLGHAEVFRTLQSQFGRDNVFIATSNKVELPKSPFNFTEKTVFMNAAGVPSDRILQVTNPYKLPQPPFNDANTIFIAVLGSPDRNRLSVDGVKKDGSPDYFKTFESLDKCVTADKHGYVLVVDEKEKYITINGQNVDVSHGTKARAEWNKVRDNPKLRSEYLLQMFGRDDAELGRILDKIPQTVNEEAAGVGVVANKKQARDPRYSMSITKDVRPGEVGRQLKKMHLADSVSQLQEQIATLKEKWSAKYKRSINCNSPRGFSQRAHCAGRKK
jgi:cytidyltransferase-like protein